MQSRVIPSQRQSLPLILFKHQLWRPSNLHVTVCRPYLCSVDVCCSLATLRSLKYKSIHVPATVAEPFSEAKAQITLLFCFHNAALLELVHDIAAVSFVWTRHPVGSSKITQAEREKRFFKHKADATDVTGDAMVAE